MRKAVVKPTFNIGYSPTQGIVIFVTLATNPNACSAADVDRIHVDCAQIMDYMLATRCRLAVAECRPVNNQRLRSVHEVDRQRTLFFNVIYPPQPRSSLFSDL